MLKSLKPPVVQLALLLISLTAGATAQSNPFEGDILAFEAEEARNPPAPNSIVFIGSSTIRGWTDLASSFPGNNVLNRGFGGSQTSDALFYVDRLATPHRPPLVVLYEGDNDIAAGKSTDQIFADTTNFFARVRIKSPNTHVLYLSVKPSPSRAAFLPAMVALNNRVREFVAGDPKLHYVDIYSPMLNTSGQPRPELFTSDNLHMNAAGYALWTSIMRPIVDEFTATYPIPIGKTRSGSILIDFGGTDARTGEGVVSPVAWNNVSSLGTSSAGALANILTTSGLATGVGLQMVSRFNGANENGTTASTLFPATATRDSLFGNTQTFGGLANVTPVFKLTGLEVGEGYRLTFYASRTGVGDNRQTRYTATGQETTTVDLNPANNIDQVAVIPSLPPSAGGEITIALTPGPANNNANRFTYLGVLKLESLRQGGPAFLFDFGAGASPTSTQAGEPTIAWNNLTQEVGATDTGTIADLVGTNGFATGAKLQMISRFNGFNANGTSASSLFPASATQDSLYGNVEPFNGLANVAPKFAFLNLDPLAFCNLTFHASRTGVSDNRETRYVVAGETSAFADLNPSNNLDAVATVAAIRPDASGALAVSLEPGPNNNNANHFTYLGVLRLDWSTAVAPQPIRLSIRLADTGRLVFGLAGSSGMIYTLQASANLVDWSDLATIEMVGDRMEYEIPEPAGALFFRLLQ